MNVNEMMKVLEGLKNAGVEEVEVFGMAVEEDHEYWQDFNTMTVDDGKIYFDYDYNLDLQKQQEDEEERQFFHEWHKTHPNGKYIDALEEWCRIKGNLDKKLFG